MFKKTLLALTAAAAATGAVLPGAAQAQYWGNAPAGYDRYERGYVEPVRYRGDRRNWDNRRYDNRRYDRRAAYRGNRCYDPGNGGLAIGGIAGGLLGNEVAGRGDRTLGTVLGAAVGALAGRAIDKSDGARC